eukprot:TRINITY_DN28699_c0_g1_i1.p1 TRINITY_DN28699_c0_g1~~TRINITY_DN28699_c0_g1_i1.p1  ORF type:complete len:384 (+),score=45.67 TRINITY_DN28699_c0_g1_i1:77-1228(+)
MPTQDAGPSGDSFSAPPSFEIFERECLLDWESSWPRSVVFAANVSKTFGFLYDCRNRYRSKVAFGVTMMFQLSCISIALYSAWYDYEIGPREHHEHAHGVDSVVVACLVGSMCFAASMFTQMVMYFWGFVDMLDDLRALTVPSITGTNGVFITIVIINQCVCVYMFFHPDLLVQQFGPVYQRPWILGILLLGCSIIAPGACGSMSLLMGIASGLRRELRSVEERLLAGDLAGAEHSYGRFLKFMNITRRLYEACAAPLVAQCIAITSYVVTKEIDNYVDGGSSSSSSSSSSLHAAWALVSVFLLFFVTASMGDLPTRHACLRVVVSAYSQTKCRRDVTIFLAIMNAMQDQSGMKIFGVLITRSFLVKCISAISVVFSVLKRLS